MNTKWPTHSVATAPFFSALVQFYFNLKLLAHLYTAGRTVHRGWLKANQTTFRMLVYIDPSSRLYSELCAILTGQQVDILCLTMVTFYYLSVGTHLAVIPRHISKS